MKENPAIALIGHDGMVGRAYGEHLTVRGERYRGVSWPEIDLGDSDSIKRIVTDDLSLVVNCGAWTDVDGAEEHEDEAMAINGDGVGFLADRCRQIGALLVHFSTDYVFRGDGSSPYPTEHSRAPLNAYGRTKARGEELIESSGCEHLIVRTSWAYASWGKNFVLTIDRLANERSQLSVIDDQQGRPTRAEHLVETSHSLVKAEGRGMFHVTDGGECTWFELAREIVEGLGIECAIVPCTTADYPLPAKRPSYSTLDLSKTEGLLGRTMPDWRENLARTLEQMKRHSR